MTTSSRLTGALTSCFLSVKLVAAAARETSIAYDSTDSAAVYRAILYIPKYDLEKLKSPVNSRNVERE